MTDASSGITSEMIGNLVPFARFLEVGFPVLTSTKVIAYLPYKDGYCTIGGGVHGGAQMALADIAAAVMAVLADGDPSSAPATMQSSTNFLEAAHGDLTATATVLRRGRSAVIDVVISDENGRQPPPCAKWSLSAPHADLAPLPSQERTASLSAVGRFCTVREGSAPRALTRPR